MLCSMLRKLFSEKIHYYCIFSELYLKVVILSILLFFYVFLDILYLLVLIYVL